MLHPQLCLWIPVYCGEWLSTFSSCTIDKCISFCTNGILIDTGTLTGDSAQQNTQKDVTPLCWLCWLNNAAINSLNGAGIHPLAVVVLPRWKIIPFFSSSFFFLFFSSFFLFSFLFFSFFFLLFFFFSFFSDAYWGVVGKVRLPQNVRSINYY